LFQGSHKKKRGIVALLQASFSAVGMPMSKIREAGDIALFSHKEELLPPISLSRSRHRLRQKFLLGR
jgi:hypothetical protein